MEAQNQPYSESQVVGNVKIETRADERTGMYMLDILDMTGEEKRRVRIPAIPHKEMAEEMLAVAAGIAHHDQKISAVGLEMRLRFKVASGICKRTLVKDDEVEGDYPDW